MEIRPLHRPLKEWRINQKFGENTVCVSTKGPNVYINCDGKKPPKGYKSVYSQMDGHNGLDLYAPSWTPFYFAHSGTVVEVETEVDRGLGVGVVSDVPIFCYETGKYEFVKTRYWHLAALDVGLNDHVKLGEFGGYCDNTGRSTASHLHFEVKPVAKNKQGQWYNILQDNGYFGAVDPALYLSGVFAPNVSTIGRILEEIAKRLDALTDKIRNK